MRRLGCRRIAAVVSSRVLGWRVSKPEGIVLKVVFTRGALRYAMQTLRGAVTARTTLPILGNLLLDCGKESIEMSATDLEVGIRTRA